MLARITAPWRPSQVRALNAYQTAGTGHPFTCPTCGEVLTATEAGWLCPRDEYRQDWAHAFMADSLATGDWV